MILLLAAWLAGDDPVAALEALHRRAAEAAEGSVVAIQVKRDPKGEASLLDTFMDRLRGGDLFASRPADAWCSGTIVEPGGMIVTTWFNVSEEPRSITVRLPDGREFEARILGRDAALDLALLKIDANHLPVLSPAPADEFRAGRRVMALGRAPGGSGLTVNPGILSAASRLEGRAVQTDARLNFANVGGPLVDAGGRLVGITCKVDVKYASRWGQNSGVGFAITREEMEKALPELKEGRPAVKSGRPFLGVSAADEDDAEGVPLLTVQPGSAADRAGLQAGDVVLSFDGKETKTFTQLRDAILSKTAGDRVAIRFRRGEAEKEAECELDWTLE